MDRIVVGSRHRFVTVLVILALLAGCILSSRGGRDALAAGIPAGLPGHFGIGLSAQPNSTGLDGWMPQSGIPWDYAYQYLSGGVNTGSGWETWNTSGTFALNYAKDSASHGYIPVFSYYELLQSSGSCGSCAEQPKDLSNLNNAGLMKSYFANFRLLMQRLGSGSYGGITGFGKTVIVQVEPDLSGYAEQAVLNNSQCSGYCTAQGNNPAYLKASVASSGDPDVAAYPNTYQGFNWALLHIRDLYAKNVLLAFHVSDWATGTDISSSHSTTVNASALGQEAGSFAAQSGITGVPSGTSTYDLLFNDVADRDAAYYQYVYNNPNYWWDRNNVTFPNFHRWESYIGSISQTASRKVMVWQVPLGNQYFDTENNTNGHYQDNRAEYFFGHIAELASSGIIGILFGAGNGGSTVNYDGMKDGTTNPAGFCTTNGISSGQVCDSHTSTVADDDGGYIRMEAQQYYASGGYSLTGGTTTPVPTSSATATPKPTATTTAQATATATTTPPATATSTPTATSTASGLVLGNFEGSTDGWSGNGDVTSLTPSTYAPAVALGSDALQIKYNVPSAWSEAQLSKWNLNTTLTSYSTLSVSVYPVAPTVSGTGVKVQLFGQGSDGNWYYSAFQTVPIGSRSTVTWNISSVPRAPMRQLYVAWQFTTSATSSGNTIYLDAIRAS
ncbi:MAG TPA: hypothetical protein VFB58_17015 [Chloroflexota bacterium]|nr:hypothetical protein [Chloroflexota bacterium]